MSLTTRRRTPLPHVVIHIDPWCVRRIDDGIDFRLEGYRLLSVFVSISYGARTTGVAVGWAVASEETEQSWGLFFDCLKQNVEHIRRIEGENPIEDPFSSYALVSDDTSSAWNAAKSVFHVKKRYLCLWHVLQNFLRHTSPVSPSGTVSGPECTSTVSHAHNWFSLMPLDSEQRSSKEDLASSV